MTNLPANIILLWPSTNGSIPAGYTRVTALDGKAVKGANGDTAGTTGGAATHTHTSPAHAHDIETHQHTYTVPNLANPYHDRRLPNPANGNTTEQSHTHNGITDNNAQPGTTTTTAVTYGSVSNWPPYFEVIFIKGDGAHPIPDGAIILTANTTLPANYSIHAGLKGLYAKGAPTAGDGGGSGGSYTNVHDIGHGHTGGTHDHGSTTSSSDLNYTHYQTSGVRDFTTDHSHTFTPSATTVACNNFVGSLTCPETVEPVYKKLLPIQQSAGGDLTPGMIGLWLGAIADIPAGWNLCDGSGVALDMRDHYLKCANDTTELLATGGSNTHTHAAQPHNHTASAHTHAAPQLGHFAQTYNGQLTNDLAGYTPLIQSEVHDSFNLDNASANYQNANTTADSASNEPPYVTAHFIMFNKTFSQLSKPFSYKIRLTNLIQKPFSYKVRLTGLITVPFQYVIKRVIWTKVPKPDTP